MPFLTTYPSPLGSIRLLSDGNALTGLWLDTQAMPEVSSTVRDDLPLFAQAKHWLDAYFAGEDLPMDFPLNPEGTAFRKAVWRILLTIPQGQTTTYGHIARLISPTMSAQAVGGAVGANPISILIPCHRVLGAGGALTGYAGGLDKKIRLLRHEGVTL